MKKNIVKPKHILIGIGFLITTTLISILILVPSTHTPKYLSGATKPYCNQIRTTGLTIASIRDADPPVNNQQRQMRQQILQHVADIYRQGKNLSRTPDYINNSLYTATKSVDRAADEILDPTKYDSFVRVLDATLFVNANLARWCRNYNPPA